MKFHANHRKETPANWNWLLNLYQDAGDVYRVQERFADALTLQLLLSLYGAFALYNDRVDVVWLQPLDPEREKRAAGKWVMTGMSFFTASCELKS